MDRPRLELTGAFHRGALRARAAAVLPFAAAAKVGWPARAANSSPPTTLRP